MLSLIRNVKAPLERALSFPSFRAVGSLTFCPHAMASLGQPSMSICKQAGTAENYDDVARRPPNRLIVVSGPVFSLVGLAFEQGWRVPQTEPAGVGLTRRWSWRFAPNEAAVSI